MNSSGSVIQLTDHDIVNVIRYSNTLVIISNKTVASNSRVSLTVKKASSVTNMWQHEVNLYTFIVWIIAKNLPNTTGLVDHSCNLQREFRGTLDSMKKIYSETADNNEEILVEVCNNKGIITLNRPKSLNALTVPMLKKLLTTLRKWEDNMTLVVAKSINKKAFCAGGDIFQMTEGGTSNPQNGIDAFHYCYKVVYTIRQYKIPYIALTDGITMGGGVGMSWAGKYCIATENSIFAMPEAAIGFSPDIGISFFFSRLERNLGLYLALTGHRLQGKDAVKIGFASHYVESNDIPALLDEILNLENGDVESVIENYSQDMSMHTFSLAPHMHLINEAFSAPTVEQIIERLQSDESEFSNQTLQQLNKMSPITLKTVKVQLEKAASMTLKECLQMDYRLGKAAINATSSMDFHEGARALKEKRAPKWNPGKLEDVTDDMVNKLFLSLPPEQELLL